jgi:hypothetical protein
MRSLSICALLALAATDAGAVNLALNGAFDSTILIWQDPNDSVTLAWSPLDADGSPSSGSIEVTTTNTSGGSTGAIQCATVGAANVEVLRADVRFLEQGAVDPVNGQIFVTYYNALGCLSPNQIGQSAFPGVPEGTDWTPLEVALAPPVGTLSILIWLTIAYQTNPSPLVANFDNVYLPEPAGQGVAALAVLGAVSAARRSRRARRRARAARRS